MKLSIKALNNYSIITKDEYVYKIKDILINEDTWRIQYLKIDIGNILHQNIILVPRFLIEGIDLKNKRFKFGLYGANIKNCPSQESDLPISTLYKNKLDRFFARGDYWARQYYPPNAVPGITASNLSEPTKTTVKIPRIDESQIDSSIRSLNEILNYTIETKNGPKGKLVNLIVDTGDWEIISIVVKTRSKLGIPKKVITARQWIEEISFENQKILVNLNQDEIESSPKVSSVKGIMHPFKRFSFEN